MAFITTTAASISSGGTINGDITIEGDLTVNGDGSGNYDEIINGNLVLSSGSKLGIGIGDVDPSAPLEVKGDAEEVLIVGRTTSTANSQPTTITSTALKSNGAYGAMSYIKSEWNDNTHGSLDSNISFWTRDDNTIAERLTINESNVGIGTASPSNLASNGLQIQNTTTSSSTEGGEVKLTSNDGSALESGHRLGGVMFSAYEDSGSTQINGASIEAFAESNWTGSNNSTFLTFKTNQSDNSYLERMRITSGGLVGIGCVPTEALHISSSEASSTPVLLLENTNANNLAPQINFYKNTSDEADGDIAGQIDFEGNDSAGNRTEYGRIITEQYRVLSGAEDGIMDFKVAVDGTLTNGMRIRGGTGARVGIGSGATNPSEALEINASGANLKVVSDDNVYLSLDTTQANGDEWHIFNAVGGTTSNLQFKNIDQSKVVMLLDETGKVGVGTVSPDYQLELEQAGGGFLSFKTTDTELQNNDVLGTIQFGADDATHTGIDIGAKIVATVTDNFQSAGSNVDAPTRLDFFTQDNTTADVFSTVGATLTLGGDNQDAIFRGNVGIGTTPDANTPLHIKDATYGRVRIESTGSNSFAILYLKNDAIEYAVRTSGSDVFEVRDETAGAVRLAIDANSRINLSNNGGTSNTVFGYQAGNLIASGDNYNVFIGHQVADADMTNATQNVGIGYQSLSGLTTGDSNTAVGSGSLYSLNTGNYNVAMGHLAGDAITSAQYSVAIGYGSLGAEVTRGTSVAIGYEALALQTEGSDGANSENVGIGFQAGLRNVTGTANTSVGFEAMKGASGQSNSNNVAIGKKALLVIETGSDNVAVGSEAGYSITTGHTNVFIGSAVGNATTINNSIGIGNDAMGAVPSGQAVEHAIAIGVDAMKGSGSTTDGINGNIAIGSSAGFLLTTGGNNTLIGYATADELLTGSNNTTLGRHSLGNADGDEDDNTCIGYNSGASIDNGNDNTIIGSGANIGGAGTGENQAVIGKGATGQADNSVTLGNADVTAVYMAQDSGATVHTAGIQFPASQVANGGANVLDDYEEGDHTATIVGSTSGNYVVNSTNDILRYTKIGRLVNIQGLLLIDSDNSASGTLRISLPFTIGDGTGLGGRSYGSGYLDSHGGTIAGQVNTKLVEGDAYFILVEVADNGTPTDVNDSQVDGAFNIGVNFSYTV